MHHFTGRQVEDGYNMITIAQAMIKHLLPPGILHAMNKHAENHTKREYSLVIKEASVAVVGFHIIYKSET